VVAKHRVLVLSPSAEVFGLPNTGAYRRIRGLALRHTVTLIVPHKGVVADDLRNLLVVKRPPAVPGRQSGILAYYLFALFHGLWNGFKGNYDAVYSYQELSSVIGIALKAGPRMRWIADILDDPGMYLENLKQRPRSRRASGTRAILLLHERAMKGGLRFADLVLTIGTRPDDVLPRLMEEAYKVHPDRLLAIPNGVELDLVRPSGSPSRLAETQLFEIFYVGHVSPIRGLGALLEAVSKLHADIPTIKVTLAGAAWPDDKEWLTSNLVRLGIEERVEYVGPVEHRHALELMERASVCVCLFQRRREEEASYPIKVLEYLALGKATICTNLLGMRRLITPEVNGLLVEPDDPDDLAQALSRLYHDEELRRRIQANARASVERFDWPAIVERVLERVDCLFAGEGKV